MITIKIGENRYHVDNDLYCFFIPNSRIKTLLYVDGWLKTFQINIRHEQYEDHWNDECIFRYDHKTKIDDALSRDKEFQDAVNEEIAKFMKTNCMKCGKKTHHG